MTPRELGQIGAVAASVDALWRAREEDLHVHEQQTIKLDEVREVLAELRGELRGSLHTPGSCALAVEVTRLVAFKHTLQGKMVIIASLCGSLWGLAVAVAVMVARHFWERGN